MRTVQRCSVFCAFLGFFSLRMWFECLLGTGLRTECWRSQGEQAAPFPKELRLQAWRTEGDAFLWKDMHSRRWQRGGRGRIQAQLDTGSAFSSGGCWQLALLRLIQEPESLTFVNSPSYQCGNRRPMGQIHAAACFRKARKLRIVFTFLIW